MTYSEIRSDPDEAMATIVYQVRRDGRALEAVVVLGSDYTDVASNTELAFNEYRGQPRRVGRARGLGSRAGHRRRCAIAEGAIAEFIRAHNKVVAVIVTRVADDPDSIKAFEWALSTIPDIITFAMPAHPLLAALTIGAQLEAAQASAPRRSSRPARPGEPGRPRRGHDAAERAAAPVRRRDGAAAPRPASR